MPLFFKLLHKVAPIEIIAHRVIWAVPILLVILAFRKQLGEYRSGFAHWSSLRWMILSSILISINWLVYVYAVNAGEVLAASLGYYLNPLVNILLGTVFLKERLNRTQWMAVAIAGLAVLLLAYGALSTLWLSVTLACSFGIYGLVRKLAPIGAVPGLAVETSLLLPIALMAALYFHGQPAHFGWGSTSTISLLLMAGGLITAIPLLLFATAARRMPYSVIGFIQYIGPTIQFLLALFLYHEPLSGARLIAFLLIWVALCVFSYDAIRRMRTAT